MQLNDERPNIETSGNMEEQFFSIQDQGMIFDILRNKMYSDPILAICREISCNARDAHREVGKMDVPIVITLPNHLEPFYKIKDFGPGISPERMSNVFIKYTASTKRNDNLQTGGFGLGAKTPFSYSDTFTITTIFNKVKYNYACFIDETKVGKLILMGEEPSNEENSTEIDIPVKTSDFNKFIVATEQSTRHWDIKPIIKGDQISWTNYESTLSGTNWKIAGTKNASNGYNSYGYYDYNRQNYDRGIKILVDGIEYHVSMESLNKFANSTVVDACKGYLFLYFNIGELSLAANRESIYIDKATEAKIIERLDLVKEEILKSVTDTIDAFPTFAEANAFYYKDLHSMFNDITFLGPLFWNKIKLFGSSIHLQGILITEFYKAKTYRGKYPNIEKIRSRTSNSLQMKPSVAVYYNDLDIKNVTYKHVKEAFDAGKENIQVINPHKSISFEDLDKEYSLTGMGVELISTITNAAIKNKAVSGAKMLVFKVTGGTYNTYFEQVPYDSIKDDTKVNKVLCFFDRSDNVYGKQYKQLYVNGSKSQDRLYPLFSEFKDDTSFYAIQKDTDEARIKKDFVGFILLDDFINDKILKSNIDFVGIKAASTQYLHCEIDSSKWAALKALVKDPKSLYIQKISAIKIISELRNKKDLVSLYEYLVKPISNTELSTWLKAHPELHVDKLEKMCHDKYPLLGNNNLYHTKLEHITQYVNFIDSI